jgi:hypothetical protein
LENINVNRIANKPTSSKLGQTNRKVAIYLIFVVIAGGLWLLNELNNEFITNIKYPVIFVNFPKDKTVENQLPTHLNLKVKSFGYNLVRYRLAPPINPLVISLKDYSFVTSNPKTQWFTLETIYEQDKLNRQLPNDLQLVNIDPDTIQFIFTNLVKRKVPVVPDLNLHFEPQCMVDGNIKFNPDSVTIIGPALYLDTIKSISTKKTSIKNLNKTITKSIALEVPIPLKSNILEIMMTVPVAKFTQSIIEVPISVVNVPDSLRLMVFPRMAKVSFMVSLDNYPKVNANDFIIELNYNDLVNLIGQKAPIQLRLTPPIIHKAELLPPYVEFLIETQP